MQETQRVPRSIFSRLQLNPAPYLITALVLQTFANPDKKIDFAFIGLSGFAFQTLLGALDQLNTKKKEHTTLLTLMAALKACYGALALFASAYPYTQDKSPTNTLLFSCAFSLHCLSRVLTQVLDKCNKVYNGVQTALAITTLAALITLQCSNNTKVVSSAIYSGIFSQFIGALISLCAPRWRRQDTEESALLPRTAEQTHYLKLSW